MGATYSTMQIRLPEGLKKEAVKDFLSEGFKKRGLEPATKEKAKYSYWFKVHESGKWASFGSADYGLEKAQDEVVKMAEVLDSPCLLTTVVDSDFFVFFLSKPNSTERNVLMGGVTPFEDDLSGSQKVMWGSLLKDGKTFSDLGALCKKQSVFVEDLLPEAEELFEMDEECMSDGYDCTEEAPEEEGVIELYFKDTKEKRAITFGSMMKKEFGERIKKYGFIKLKGRQPYYGRMVGDEILHVITYRKQMCYKRGYQGFEILAGVATVYREDMNFDETPSNNLYWLSNLRRFYFESSTSNIDSEISKRLDVFYYKDEDRDSFLKELEFAFDRLEELVFTVLDTVTDLDSCVKYFYNYRSYIDLHRILEFKEGGAYDYNEGLAILKLNLADDGEFLRSDILYKERFPAKFLRDKKWQKRAIEEMEKRKIKNLSGLLKYGIDVRV